MCNVLEKKETERWDVNFSIFTGNCKTSVIEFSFHKVDKTGVCFDVGKF